MVDPVAICVSELVSITYEISLTGAIDPPSYLNDSRVYLFSGILDTVIVQGDIIYVIIYDYLSIIRCSKETRRILLEFLKSRKPVYETGYSCRTFNRMFYII